MELLLNLVWLVVACAALTRWMGSRTRGVPAGRRTAWRVELFALGCALVLLFPIISLSDDLQAELAAVEASRGAQPTLKSGGALSSAATAKPLPVAPGAGTATSFHGCNRFLYRLDGRVPTARSHQLTSCLALRAPPLTPSL